MFRISNLDGWIMNKDEEVARITIERGELLQYKILSKNLPVEFLIRDSESEAIMDFLEDRVVPSTRIGITNELKAIGIPYYDPTLILNYNHGISFDDTFWIRFVGEQLSYAEIHKRMLEV